MRKTRFEVPATHAKHPRIVRWMRRQIVKGVLQPGDQLPTYDALEAKFGVSRATVMQAVTRLKRDGFVRAARPLGLFVADHPPHLANVGIVFADNPSEGGSFSKFSGAVLRAAQLAMAHRPGKLLTYDAVHPRADNEGYRMLLADLAAHRLSGLIFAATAHSLDGTAAMTDPLVARVGLSISSGPAGTPAVHIDPADFRARCIDLLLKRGRRRVALLIGGDKSPSADQNLHQWVAALQGAGLETEPRWHQHVSLPHSEWASNLARLLFERQPAELRPDALIITDDHYVEAATHGIAQLDVRVPEELDIVAATNFPWPTDNHVAVTRLGYDVRQLVRECLRVLDAQHRGETVPAMTRIRAQFEAELEAA